MNGSLLFSLAIFPAVIGLTGCQKPVGETWKNTAVPTDEECVLSENPPLDELMNQIYQQAPGTTVDEMRELDLGPTTAESEMNGKKVWTWVSADKTASVNLYFEPNGEIESYEYALTSEQGLCFFEGWLNQK